MHTCILRKTKYHQPTHVDISDVNELTEKNKRSSLNSDLEKYQKMEE